MNTDFAQSFSMNRQRKSICTYGVDIPAGTWHNLVVIEPAVIFEAKDGAYKPISPEDVL